MTSAVDRLRELPEAFTFARLPAFPTNRPRFGWLAGKRRGSLRQLVSARSFISTSSNAVKSTRPCESRRYCLSIRAPCSAESPCFMPLGGSRRFPPAFRSRLSRGPVMSPCMGLRFRGARFRGSGKCIPRWIQRLINGSMVCELYRHRSHSRTYTAIRRAGILTSTTWIFRKRIYHPSAPRRDC
jgi:hypothetical protein